MLKKIISFLIIVLFISSCIYGNNTIKTNKENNSEIYFIIDYDVKVYKDQASSDIQKNVTFFDSMTLLSDEISPKGRIYVKLQDDTKGWVDEKYTSYIPKEWKKLILFENYFCFNFSDKKLDIKKDELKQAKMYYYSNRDIAIAMGVSFLSNYQQNLKSIQNILNMQIQGGHDKKLNWFKEITLDNYKIVYVITTDHENGGICESFDFIKLDEMDLKKYYTVGIDYMPYTSEKKKLLWRKILFSTLQSLK